MVRSIPQGLGYGPAAGVRNRTIKRQTKGNMVQSARSNFLVLFNIMAIINDLKWLWTDRHTDRTSDSYYRAGALLKGVTRPSSGNFNWGGGGGGAFSNTHTHTHLLHAEIEGILLD